MKIECERTRNGFIIRAEGVESDRQVAPLLDALMDGLALINATSGFNKHRVRTAYLQVEDNEE